MNLIAFCIEMSKLAIMAIILWFVCEALNMPAAPKRVCQLLIVLIAILVVISMTQAGAYPQRPAASHQFLPSIIAPERR